MTRLRDSLEAFVFRCKDSHGLKIGPFLHRFDPLIPMFPIIFSNFPIPNAQIQPSKWFCWHKCRPFRYFLYPNTVFAESEIFFFTKYFLYPNEKFQMNFFILLLPYCGSNIGHRRKNDLRSGSSSYKEKRMSFNHFMKCKSE